MANGCFGTFSTQCEKPGQFEAINLPTLIPAKFSPAYESILVQEFDIFEQSVCEPVVYSIIIL